MSRIDELVQELKAEVKKEFHKSKNVTTMETIHEGGRIRIQIGDVDHDVKITIASASWMDRNRGYGPL